MMKFTILLMIGVIARQTYGDEPEAILGGNNAKTGQFPYQVSLWQQGRYICGGSIIDTYHIITSALCLPFREDWSSLTVVTGITSLTERGESHNITCIQMNPDYNDPHHVTGDIAVITVATPIISNARQAPIPLASKDYDIDGYPAILSGWGWTNRIDENPQFSDILQWVAVKIFSRSKCKNMVGWKEDMSPFFLCTLDVGKSACVGDDGGPLVINNEFVGIMSGSFCTKGAPDLFTNIYYYRGFIQQCQSNSPTPDQCPPNSRVQ